jgi:hypothetical protein
VERRAAGQYGKFQVAREIDRVTIEPAVVAKPVAEDFDVDILPPEKGDQFLKDDESFGLRSANSGRQTGPSRSPVRAIR